MQQPVQSSELEDVRVIDIKKNIDDRGFFSEVARRDWLELFGEQWISQVNLSMSYPGVVRAWHRHERGQIDYYMVLKGSLRICAYDDDKSSPTYGKLAEVVTSQERLQVVRIPGKYWHGTKTMSSEPSLTIYFVSGMYDHKNPDELRRPWNDPLIVDPRTKQPYDWNRSINK